MDFSQVGTSAFTSSQWSTLSIVTSASAGLGAVGSLATCAAYLRWKHMRTAIARIIFYMAIADLISSVSMALGRLGPSSGENSALCQLQAVGQQWGDISSILWTCMISINLIWIMFRGRAVDDLHRYNRLHLAICFVFPIVWAVVPVFAHPAGQPRVYGDADLWCWVVSVYPQLQLILFYIPLWIVFVFNFFTYLAVGRLIWKRARYIIDTNDMEDVNNYRYTFGKNVSLYLLAFLFTWTPATLNRIYTMVFSGQRSYVLTLLHSLGTPSRGLTNCLVYFYVSWYLQIRASSRREQEMGGAAGVVAIADAGSRATSEVDLRAIGGGGSRLAASSSARPAMQDDSSWRPPASFGPAYESHRHGVSHEARPSDDDDDTVITPFPTGARPSNRGSEAADPYHQQQRNFSRRTDSHGDRSDSSRRFGPPIPRAYFEADIDSNESTAADLARRW
ncbi:slime mold cyclic AMP receptor-domain-containing protein [Thamnocephalis sphaerospora]|uniref:Slime mold cyclic AMP receptor-domain-containing protein n=1 Tax=Thamnocephalis sphaerospora TaxID=78915 RepID=A0A4P9XSM2_9FUNG|nr:slime mold cyclic AMP receptor-domain-containing protein [Thamnocephalis sphaerospora]|eukprot:RKP08992.1 slime mold cyclic AMP receptor-domain-containing protein [Thamnocephalis sphaerospora]